MNIEKTVRSLEKCGYTVRFFHTGSEAAQYLESTVRGKTIVFGGARTLTDLNLLKILEKNNTVYAPDFPKEGENFRSTAMQALDTDYYFLSANALSENGEIVNIDATGNRLGGSLFGHQKIFYVIGTNKIEPDLEKAVWRARNIAAPRNAVRFHLNTPCAVKGDKCYNCSSPDRICSSLLIHLRKVDSAEAEVILIDEELGF